MKNNKWFYSIRGVKYLIIVILLITVLFSVIIISLERNSSLSQVENINEQSCKKTALAFENEINKITDLSRYLSVTPLTPLPEEFTPEEYRKYYYDTRQFAIISAISEEIVGMSLKYGEETVNYNTGNNNYSNAVFNETYSLNKNTQLLKSDNDEGFIYIRYIPKGITAGADEILFKVSLLGLSKACVQSETDNKKNFVILPDGTIIASSAVSEIGKDFKKQYNAGPSEINGGIKKVKSIDKNTFYFSKTASEGGIMIISGVSLEYYDETALRNFLVGFVFCIFFLLLIFILIAILYKSFLKPIYTILQSVDSDTLNSRKFNDDVLKYINSNIIGLHDKNNILSENNKKMLEELKYQQILACQMQINPHFLSNTLSAINWMALEKFKEIDNPISNSLSSLSDIFFSSINAGEIVVKLKQEIDETQKYISILKMRYGENLTVVWDVEKELLDEYILKISMQPLIENCANYAFGQNKAQVQITVCVKTLNNDIKVTVRDNGVGIEKDKLENLRISINDFTKESNKHIGLKNINRRLKLLYGNEYGLRIESESYVFTECSFQYPKSKN